MAWFVGTSLDDALYGTSGDDILWGLDGDDTLIGNAGNDQLEGGAGADAMAGGTGDDTYYVDNAGDIVFEVAGQGTDTVRSSVDFTLGSAVENLVLTGSAGISGTGNSLDNRITGNAGANALFGGGGHDTVFGGAGADFLDGGSGNDTLDGGSEADSIFGGEGNDTLLGGDGFDFLTGGNGNDMLLGGAGADSLTGGMGIDTLDGGTDADTMRGGLGDDIYYVDVAGDIVTELADQGIDRVNSSFTLTLGANLEQLVLLGSAAINGTGNSLDNLLRGNASANILVGLGGNDILDGRAGADTMIGGTGNDEYRVDDVADIVDESAGDGVDTVISSIAYVLSADLENLQLIGTAAINGAGNDLDNIINGNVASNVLTGGEGDDKINYIGLVGEPVFAGKDGGVAIVVGIGPDTMIGGVGDDIYGVHKAGDLVIENAGEGTDRVWTRVNYTLGANVEALLIYDGAGAINGNGNALNNLMEGNESGNTLDGGDGADDLYGNAGNDVLIGGAGVDLMVGGTGIDRFHLRAMSDSPVGGADFIADFSSIEADKIDLSAIDANAVAAGDQDFNFIGNNNAFTNTAGELRFNAGFVEGDVDGDGNADFQIQVNAASLASADFVL